MFHIPRSLARQLRAVFRRAIGGSRRTEVWAQFHATAAELVVRVVSDDAAIEYRAQDCFEPADFVIPLDLLRECEAKSTDPVAFERGTDGHVTAHWHNRGIPQQRSGNVPTKDIPEFPPLPSEFASNEPGLFRALADAADTTDPESSRYALGCIALRGAEGQVVATDGRQALLQSGYKFPFAEQLLVPALEVFGCRDLPQDQPVRIGSTGKHVTLAVGPWTIHLRIDDGRYPITRDLVPPASTAASRLELNAVDGAFLAESIPRLPHDDARFLPVTLDLNGEAVIRAQSAGQTRPTDLVLSNSHLDGQPMRFSTNGKHLKRAAELGLRELCFFSPSQAVLARDERRQYIWMPCSEDKPIPPAADAQRIESPLATQRLTVHRSQPKEKSVTSTVPAAQETAAAAPKPKKRCRPAMGKTPVEQAIALRDTLRTAAKLANDLAREFKSQKRQARIVQSTLESLKSLQKIAG